MDLTTLLRLGDDQNTQRLTEDCTPYSVYCGATSIDSDVVSLGPYIVYGGTSAAASVRNPKKLAVELRGKFGHQKFEQNLLSQIF